MRKLIIDQTSNTPNVIFDPQNGLFEISGESRPSDVAAFYIDILNWFDDFLVYLEGSNDIKYPIIIKIDFSYFNSASAKYILDLCKQAGSALSSGKSFEIKWLYDENDRDMLEAGREMSRLARLPFEFIMKR